MLGVLLEFGAAPNLQTLAPGEWDRAGRAGFAVAKYGEAGIRDAFSQVQAAFRASGGKPGPRKIFGRLYEWLAFSGGDKDAGDIQRILREHIFDTMDLPAGKEILGAALPSRRLHSVASLASEAGLDSRTLRNVLIAAGLVPARAEPGSEPPFDAEAGRNAAASVQRIVPRISLPKALGCTRPQAEQLLDARILTPLADEHAFGAGRTHKAVDARHVEDFLARLRDAAAPVEAAPAGMVSIAKAAEMAKTRCAEIMHLILGGFLDHVARRAEVDGIAALLVDPGEVRAAMRSHTPGLSASEAFGALHVPNRTGWALASDRGQGPALASSMVDGPNGRHGFPRFDPTDVAAFRAEFATAAHVAHAMSLPRREGKRLLKQAGARPAISWREVGVDLYRVRNLPDDVRAALAEARSTG